MKILNFGTFQKTDGRHLVDFFSTVDRNDANDMSLERYGVGACYSFRSLLVIVYGLGTILKLLSAAREPS